MPNLAIFYPNGQVEAVQMFVWDGLKPVLWDGTVSGGGGISIPTADSVYLTQTTTSIDVYTYKLSGSTVGTMTVTYTDSSHNTLVSAVLT